MRVLAIGVVLLLGVALVAMTWQHLRYQRARRTAVHDLQGPFHSSAALHALLFVELAEGQELLESLGKLRNDVEAGGNAKVIYVGRVGLVPLESGQLPPVQWDAVMLAQYASREAYERAAGGSMLGDARARFAATYAHGFERSPLLNLAIPQMLLGLRLWQLVTFQSSIYPLSPAPDDSPRRLETPERRQMLERLRPLAQDAILVVNLLKRGTREQQAADRAYGRSMMSGMAEGGYGPMHMGRAVRLEGDAEFDQVALVYYPGIDYFVELMSSSFFHDIVGGKQPGDTLAAPTAPLLPLLQTRAPS